MSSCILDTLTPGAVVMADVLDDTCMACGHVESRVQITLTYISTEVKNGTRYHTLLYPAPITCPECGNKSPGIISVCGGYYMQLPTQEPILLELPVKQEAL